MKASSQNGRVKSMRLMIPWNCSILCLIAFAHYLLSGYFRWEFLMTSILLLYMANYLIKLLYMVCFVASMGSFFPFNSMSHPGDYIVDYSCEAHLFFGKIFTTRSALTKEFVDLMPMCLCMCTNHITSTNISFVWSFS